MRKEGIIAFLLAMCCMSGTAQIPVTEQFHLAVDELREHLSTAPLFSDASNPVTIFLPTPVGDQLTFQVWRDPILSESLQATYPGFQSYALQGTGGNYSGRLLVSPAGLDGVIIQEEQVLFIEGLDPATDLHRIYYWKLGSNYLSFDASRKGIDLATAPLRLAVLADAAYSSFHEKELPRAVLASVNGASAFLQISHGVRLQLHFLAEVEDEQVLNCRRNGFRGRAGESLKLFGDLVAEGALPLEDFDVGHLFSGRGFGSTSLPAVAGSDTYYDWNEDGIFDGPAKAAGGTGAVLPSGSNWWGNLCNGLSRQLKSSELVLQIIQEAERKAQSEQVVPTAALEQAGRGVLPLTHQVGPDSGGRSGFPFFSCLPYLEEQGGYSLLAPDPPHGLSLFSDIQLGSSNLALSWPVFFTKPGPEAFKEWLLYWRF